MEDHRREGHLEESLEDLEDLLEEGLVDLEVHCHEKSRPHCQDLELVLEQGLELELAPVLAPASYQALSWPSWMAGRTSTEASNSVVLGRISG